MWKRVKTGVQGRVVRFRAPGGAELVQGWVVAQDVLRKSGDLLVGWYRGGGAEAVLSPAEADAHRAFFVQPWQLAVVVGAGDTTVGGVLRRSASSGWAQECLPFYELVDPASFRPDGSKPTRLRWDNYRTEETALVPPVPLPVAAVTAAPGSPPALRRASSSLQPWVFLPDQFGGGDEGSGRWPSWPSPGWSDSTRPQNRLRVPRPSRHLRARSRPRRRPRSSGWTGSQTRSPWRSPRLTCVRDCSPATRCSAPSWGAGSSWSKSVGRPTTACGRQAGRRSIRPARPGTGPFTPMLTGSSGGSNARPAPDRDARRRFACLPRERSAVSGDDAGVAAAAEDGCDPTALQPADLPA